jgi:hypothetical protein
MRWRSAGHEQLQTAATGQQPAYFGGSWQHVFEVVQDEQRLPVLQERRQRTCEVAGPGLGQLQDAGNGGGNVTWVAEWRQVNEEYSAREAV